MRRPTFSLNVFLIFLGTPHWNARFSLLEAPWGSMGLPGAPLEALGLSGLPWRSLGLSGAPRGSLEGREGKGGEREENERGEWGEGGEEHYINKLPINRTAAVT